MIEQNFQLFYLFSELLGKGYTSTNVTKENNYRIDCCIEYKRLERGNSASKNLHKTK